MAKMQSMTAQPLSSYSNVWKTLPQKLVEVRPTAPPPRRRKDDSHSEDDFLFKVEGIEIEGPMTSEWTSSTLGAGRRASTSIG